jgi:putative membrane protein
MKRFAQFLVVTVAVIAGAYILPGVAVSSLLAALVFALVLGLINAFIKPFLVLITLPLNILTLGLFTLVINGIVISLATFIVPGIAVASFWSAILFSLAISIISWAMDSILGLNEPEN